jgi:iron complex outermembrane recepter protein
MVSRGSEKLSCTLGALLISAGAAWAQTAPTVDNQPPTKPASNSDTPQTSDQVQRAQATSQNSQAASAATIGEVVVTGTRQGAALQNLPVAVSAYTDERRNLVGIETESDIVNFTPSMSLNGQFLSLRGVGRYTDELGTDPGVAIYVDGIYTNSPDYLNQPDFFTDRIEILRGPQGTLSGRNAIGGSVNIIEKRPTDDFHTEERFGYNNYNYFYADASVSGPITRNIQGRLAVAYSDQPTDNGFVKNLANPRYPGSGTTRLIEGQLNWDPSDDLNVWVKVQNFSSNTAATYGVNPSQYPGAVSYGAGGLAPNPSALLPPTSNPEIGNRFVVNDNVPGLTSLSDDWTFTTQVTWKLPGASLAYTGGYSQYHFDSVTDFDGTAQNTNPWDSQIAVGPQDHKWYQNELDLKSDNADRLQWIVGAFQYWERYSAPYYDEEPNNPTLADPQYPGVAGCTFGHCPLAPPNPTQAYYTQLTNLNSQSQALFGQLDYKLTDTFKLTGGARYNWDQKQGQTSYRYVYDTAGMFFAPGISALDETPGQGANAGGPAFGSRNASWKDWTGKLGAEWQPGQNTLAYVSLTKGYKSGGMILGNFVPIPVAGPETLYAYEVGVKETLNKKLLVNADVYYYDYRNLQQVLSVDNTAGGLNLITSDLIDAQRARSYGFELESVFSPTDDLHLTVNYSYLNAKFTEFTNTLFPGQQLFDTSQKPPAGCVVAGTAATSCPGVPYKNLAGNTVPQSPANKVTVNPVYIAHLPIGSLTLSATYAWIDKQYYSVFSNSNYLAPSYYNLDLRALYQPNVGHLTVILFARNVTNQLQIVNYSTGSYTGGPANLSPAPATVFPSSGQTTYLVNPPRTYGAELQFRF